MSRLILTAGVGVIGFKSLAIARVCSSLAFSLGEAALGDQSALPSATWPPCLTCSESGTISSYFLPERLAVRRLVAPSFPVRPNSASEGGAPVGLGVQLSLSIFAAAFCASLISSETTARWARSLAAGGGSSTGSPGKGTTWVGLGFQASL